MKGKGREAAFSFHEVTSGSQTLSVSGVSRLNAVPVSIMAAARLRRFCCHKTVQLEFFNGPLSQLSFSPACRDCQVP
jgi:hypothetical protein